jgi:hypothetical protein
MAIAESRKKLENKLRVMPANYVAGMSAFFGRDVSGSIPVANYRAKVTPATAAKWETNLKNAFGL